MQDDREEERNDRLNPINKKLNSPELLRFNKPINSKTRVFIIRNGRISGREV
jgi:hypothetical protein